MAGLEGDYAVRYMEKELSLQEQMVIDLMAHAQTFFTREDGSSWIAPRRSALEGTIFDLLRREAETLARFDDPNDMYAHCFCELD